jgi:hypothetical protein
MNTALEDIEERRRKALEEQAGPLDAQLAAVPPQPTPGVQRPVYGEDLDAEALAKAYADKRQADYTAQMLNAGALMARAGGGHAPLNAGDSVRASADDRVNEVLGRRKAQDDAFKQQQLQEMSANDSPEARFRQWLVSKMKETKDVAAETGPGALGQVPADQLPGLLDYLKTRHSDKTAQTQAATTGYATMLPLLAKTLGWSPEDTATAAAAIPNMGDKDLRSMFAGVPMKGFAEANSNRRSKDQIAAQTQRFYDGLDYKAKKDFDDNVEQLSKRVDPKVASVRNTLTELGDKTREMVQKHGYNTAVGLIQSVIANHPIPQAFLKDPETKNIQRLVQSLNVLNRSDITGAAFGKEEAEDLKSTYASLLTGEDFMSSLNALSTNVNGKLNNAFAGSDPRVVDVYLSRAPSMASRSFAEQVSGTPSAGHGKTAPSAGPQSTLPRPGAIPPLSTSTPVREPSRLGAPEAEKVIGGKRYVKIGGQWHEE